MLGQRIMVVMVCGDHTKAFKHEILETIILSSNNIETWFKFYKLTFKTIQIFSKYKNSVTKHSFEKKETVLI